MTNIEMVSARKAYAEILNLNIKDDTFKDRLNKRAKFMSPQMSFVDIIAANQYLLTLDEAKRVRDVLRKHFGANESGNEYLRITALTANICQMEKSFEISISKYGKRDKSLLSTFKSCLASHVDYQVKRNAKYFEEVVWQYLITYNQKYGTHFKIDSDLPKTYYEDKYLAELIETRIH